MRWEDKSSPTQSVERTSSGTAAEFRTRYDGGWLSTRFRCLRHRGPARAEGERAITGSCDCYAHAVGVIAG
jgi:hypothetical protein